MCVRRSNLLCERLTLLADGHQAVDLVRLRDVQLGSIHHLVKLRTLVEGAAQTGLPGRRVVLIPVRQLPFELGPRLQTETEQRALGLFCFVIAT